MEREIRRLDNNINTNNESRTIEGYALLFNSKSELLDGWFYEVISPEAIDNNTINRSDVFGLLNHDNERGILSRCKFGEGTLKLEIDEKGLKYTFDAPHTALGDEVLEHIRLKNITASSFAFTVDSDEKVKNPDGTYLRTITKIERLFDISPVYTPAYSETSVDCKRMIAFKEATEAEERRIEKEKADAEEAEQIRLKEENRKELEIYYNSLKKQISK